jgi:MATE family multidrug resistance protein
MEPPKQPHASEALSWEAAPARELIRLSSPITLSFLSFAVMGLVDTLFVAKLGAAALAGVAIGAVVTNGTMGFGFGVLRGLKTLLAQARGAGQGESRVLVGAGVLVGLWIGLLALALGELAAWVVPHFMASAEAGRAAREYIAVRSLGAPIVVIYVALREARYGLGDTRSPLIASIAGNVVHALLDYVMLFVLGWGAAGAALANLLAYALQMSLLCAAQRHMGLALRLDNLASQRAVIRAGAFTGLQWAFEIGALALLSLLLAGLGDRAVAAHQLATQVVVFSFLPALAIAEAASMLVAEAVGRERSRAVHAVAHAARRVALTYASACAVVFVAGQGSIASFMTSDLALRAEARPVFWAAACYLIFESVAVAGHGVLRGVGAQRFSALCALACAWLCTPLLTLLLTRWLGLGAPGGFMARACEMATASFFVWRHVERQGWAQVAQRSRGSLLDQTFAKT